MGCWKWRRGTRSAYVCTASYTFPLSDVFSRMKTLDQQLLEFRAQRGLAMPLSGLLVWAAIGVLSFVLTPVQQVMSVFFGTGSIVYIAMVVSRWTGEHFGFKSRSEWNVFEMIFLSAVGMAVLVYAVTIPFFLENHLALPFAVAVQTGLMWVVYGAMVAAPVAIVHAIVRTVACTVAFLLAPDEGFWLQPLIVVACYASTIPLLERRWRLEVARQAAVRSADAESVHSAGSHRGLTDLPTAH